MPKRSSLERNQYAVLAVGGRSSELTLSDALVVFRVLHGTSCSEDEQPRRLPYAADDERVAASELAKPVSTRTRREMCATNLLHDVHAAESANKVDGSENDLVHERVLDADRFEDRCAVLLRPRH